jgi:hypothetical protein
VLAALGGPKRLILLPGAGYNHSLSSPDVWAEIDHWIDDVVPPPTADCRLRTADCGLPTADCGLRTADSDCRLRTADSDC